MRGLGKLARKNKFPRAFLVAIAQMVVVPAGATGTLDQSHTPASGLGISVTAAEFEWVAQTFTAGITGDLDQVDLLVWRFDTPGDLTVQIQAVSGGTPSGSVLGSTTVPQASVSDSSFTWVSCPLSPPAQVTAGTQYALVLSAPSGSDLPPYRTYGWVFAFGNPYPGGRVLLSNDSGSSWWYYAFANVDTDAAFKTYVTAATPARQLADLLASLEGIGPGRSLASKVRAAQASLARGNAVATCAQLDALRSELLAQRGGKLAIGEADAMAASISSIQQTLGCFQESEP